MWAQANLGRNGEPSHQAVDGALDAAVKEKLATYADDYDERNFFFLTAVMTTSGRISSRARTGRARAGSARDGNASRGRTAARQIAAGAQGRRDAGAGPQRGAIGGACGNDEAFGGRHSKRPIKPARRAPAPYLLHLPMHAQHV